MTNPSLKVKAEIKWAFLNKPNEMSERYQVDLCNLSAGAVKALESLGVEVKHKEGNGHYITCKSKNPIKAFDDGGAMLDSNVVVGNGSKANVLLSTYEWTFKGKKGVSPSLKRLVVTDLIEYGGGSDDALVFSEADDDDIL